jgi:hypothetical protein
MYHELSMPSFLFGTKKMCLGFIAHCKITNVISFLSLYHLTKLGMCEILHHI